MTRVKRTYRSAVRAAGAGVTRRAIVMSARRLFAAGGFAATPIDRIAREANVSVPTIYAVFGTKRAILEALLDLIDAEANVDDLKAAFAGPVDAQPEGVARFLTLLYSRGGDVIRAARAAGDNDPELRALLKKGLARHARTARMLAESWAAAGVLRKGLTAADAAPVISAISGYPVYADMRAAGWSNARYETWLADALRRLVWR